MICVGPSAPRLELTRTKTAGVLNRRFESRLSSTMEGPTRLRYDTASGLRGGIRSGGGRQTFMEHASNAQRESPDLNQFLFSIGGYGSDAFEVRWDGAALVFVHRSARNKILSLERVSPGADEWDRFWAWMDEHGCWDWPEVCVNKLDVVDGTHWNLVVDRGGRKLVSGGSNAYPGSDTAEPGDLFRAFIDQIQRLLGGVELTLR